jgi:O-antigen/teichoic acid export membrane protein
MPATAAAPDDRFSLLRNSGFLMGTTVATSLLGFGYWVIAGHELAPPSVGLGSAMISVFVLVSFCSSLGVGSTSIKLLPTRTDPLDWNRLFTAILVIPAALTVTVSLAAAAVMAIAVPHFHSLSEPSVVAAFVIGGAGTTLATACDGCAIALRRSGRQFVRNSSFALTKIPLLAVPASLLSHPGPQTLLWSWDMALVLSVALFLGVLLPGAVPTFALRWGGQRDFLGQWRLLFGYQLSSIGGQLPVMIFPAIVAAIAGPTENAYFYFTWSVGAVFFMIETSICQALFAEGSNQADLHRTVRRAVGLMVALLTPVVGFCVVFAHPLLGLFGATYGRHGAGLLRICALASVPDGITNVYIAIVSIQGRVAAAARINMLMGSVSIVGTFVLLPHLGINGVGWAWLTAESIGAIVVAARIVQYRDRLRRPDPA